MTKNEDQKSLEDTKEKLREKQIKEQIEKDDALIANEELTLDRPRAWYLQRNSQDEDTEKLVDFAERWAKLMQAEMKNQKTDHLTRKIIQDTATRADLATWGDSQGAGRMLLVGTWKYGKELGHKEGLGLIKTHKIRSSFKKFEEKLAQENAQTAVRTNQRED